MKGSPRRRALLRTLLAALALGACGPYAQLAQKLDVTARIAGDTWIAAAGAARQESRILLVGAPDADGVAPFSFSNVEVIDHGDGTYGNAVTTLQGTWREYGSAGETSLRVLHTYRMRDESATFILNRTGSTRDDTARTIVVTVKRNGGQLAVSGDDLLSGTYVGLSQALGALGTATERDAACAFWIFDLAVQTSEARIIGFGGPTMFQYRQAATFVGTVAGSVRVSISGTSINNPTTTFISYDHFQDQGGVLADGTQVTNADAGGNGHLSGVMSFRLNPLVGDPATLTTIAGTVDYGSADPVRISNGNPVGGVYVTAIDGGATARVNAATRTPSVADCLHLP